MQLFITEHLDSTSVTRVSFGEGSLQSPPPPPPPPPPPNLQGIMAVGINMTGGFEHKCLLRSQAVANEVAAMQIPYLRSHFKFFFLEQVCFRSLHPPAKNPGYTMPWVHAWLMSMQIKFVLAMSDSCKRPQKKNQQTKS